MKALVLNNGCNPIYCTISNMLAVGSPCQIQWNSVNKSTSGQPVLDLIRGGFNKRRFLKCTRRFRSKQIGCNKRLDLLAEFHCSVLRIRIVGKCVHISSRG